MKEQSFYKYYAFGYNYYLLRNENEKIKYFGSVNSLIQRIEDFLESLDDLELQVTKKIASDFSSILVEAHKKEKTDIVDKIMADRISKIIERLDPTLDAEMQLKSAYVLTEKMYSLDNLLKTPQNLFATNVFLQLSSIAQYDLKEGLKCIAFSRPTAAAFHCLRATEETIKQLYFTCIKQKRLKHLTWFPMIDALRKKKQKPISKEMFEHLDMIRDNFRNPTQHPNKIYDIDEVQDLFSNCISAINKLTKEIILRDKKKLNYLL